MRARSVVTSLLVVLGLILTATVGLAVYSRFVPGHGLLEGKLRPCGPRPNCVCTEDYPNRNQAPLAIAGQPPDEAWARLRAAIVFAGGRLAEESEDYLWATFSTPLLGFVDDVEARLDAAGAEIHLRSASRVGHSDLGRNRSRVMEIRKHFASAPPSGGGRGDEGGARR